MPYLFNEEIVYLLLDSSDETAIPMENMMMRIGQPFELAPTYVYLASDDSRFVTGQILHANGRQSTNS